MSETTSAAQAAQPVVKDPVFINTDTGAVAIIGHELVSKKALLVLAYCLTLEDFSPESGGHGVHMVVFRDDGLPVTADGKPLLGNCAPDTGSIAINLDRLFEVACAEAGEDTGESLWACYWRNYILTLLHEIHHLNFVNGRDAADPKVVDEEEELAELWAMEKMFELAKSVDIEPGNYMEFAHFAADAMTAITGGVADDSDTEFAEQQKWMLENNIMFHLPAAGEGDEAVAEMTIHTFKKFCQLMAKADDDPEWKKDTILGREEEESLESKIRAIDDTMRPAESTPLMPDTTTRTSVQMNGETVEHTVPGPTLDAAAMEDLEMPEPDMSDPNMIMMGAMAGMGGMPGMSQAIAPGDEVYYTKEYMDPNPMLNGGPAPFKPVPINPETAPINPSNTSFPVGGGAPAPGPAAPQGGFAVADQTTPQVDVYPKTGLTAQQTGEVVMSVYNKCYQHIFTHCQRLLNSDVGFAKPEAVNQMAIELNEIEKAVVVKMDCLDENSRWCPNMPTVNGLRGSIMKNTKLPCYKLYINEDGQEKVRLLLPQNPAKSNGQGGYSKPALQARGGSCIMYVMNGNDAEVAAGKTKKFLLKCVDSHWQAC